MKSKKILAMVIAAVMAFSAIVAISIKEADALEAGETMGYNTWGNCTTNIRVGVQHSSGALKIDTSGWSSTGEYFLFYPVYRNVNTQGDFSASSFSWEGPYTADGYSVRVTATGATNDVLNTGGAAITFNRSGMYIFDDIGSTRWGNDTSTYMGSLWVNTSTNYTIDSISDFYYNTTNSITVQVRDYLGQPTRATISIMNPDNTTAWHNYRTTGTTDPPLGSGNFTMAGTYTVLGYHDTDYDGSGTGIYQYPDGETNYEVYNTSAIGHYGYGNGLNFPTGGSGNPTTDANYYNFTKVGPWDPPEYNATPVTFTVNTGKPTITLTNATPVYWGYDTYMDINVTGYNGKGIAGGTVKLRKGTTYIDNDTYRDINITETSTAGNYVLNISRATTNWTNLANGSWYIVFEKDRNGDGVDEWNNSERFSITSSSPSVDLKITNDGYGTIDDNKVDIRYDKATGGPAKPIYIKFKIYGRSVSGNRAYYGDNAHENWKNITVSGDILYAVTSTTLTYSGGVWNATVIPTKPGGEIKIAVNWPGSNNGSDSETISIVNGTHVSASVPSFTYGEHLNLTVTVKNQYNVPEYNSDVNLFWEGGGAINSTTLSPTLTPATDGEYTFWIKPENQGTTAPKNITIAAKTAGTSFWGYTKVKMEKDHNMQVFVTPTSSYAGDSTLYTITVNLTNGEDPLESGLSIALLDEGGNAVTGIDENSFPITGDRYIEDREIILSGCTYTLYASNATSDSEGHNATIDITRYSVDAWSEGATNHNVLAWLIDTDVNMSFAVTPARNGTLTINNMSSTPNGSDTASTHEIDIENGVGTLESVNASTIGNLTFEYTPSDGGESRHADGIVKVTTATATPVPATIYVGESTAVAITVTHPATDAPIPNVLVGIDQGVNLSDSVLAKIPAAKETGSDGTVNFGIEAQATGNATIYIKSGTDANNPQVIMAGIRKTMTITRPASVNEGGTFDVEIKDVNGNYVTTPVTITFAGSTNTTTTGKRTLTAPEVAESLDYTIEASAEGYTSTQKDIKVINVPALQISTSITVKAGETYEIAVSNKDTGIGVVGATITITTPGGETSTHTTKAGGVLTVTAPCTTGDYTITATFGTFQSATFTVTVTGECEEDEGPGFELLTLIAAIGVAFILLRRRRRK